MSYTIKALVFLSLAGGILLSQLDLGLFSGLKQVQSDPVAKAGIAPQQASTEADGFSGRGWGQPSNSISAASVERLGASCAISQAVHNGGVRIMFPVVLEFSFQDALGNRTGPNVRSVVEAILPAGERRGFTFQMPCPRTFTRVNIQTVNPQAGIGGNGTVQAVAQLMAGKPVIDVHQLHLAIHVPDGLTMCPNLNPCQLMLRFNESWIVVWFRRDPKHPDTLIASDPQLVGPVQRGWHADIRLPLRNGVEKLTVTEEFLREPEPTGGLNQLMGSIEDMVGIKEEGR
ncbi:MAG: hypothetical protein JJE34_10510 [Alphaproteobacteria bacterium]|nr:hypothetical protein [Alphaproteobacteria bacterium]